MCYILSVIKWCTFGVKKVPVYRPYNGMGNIVPFPFPFNFRVFAVLVHFQTVLVLFQGQPSVLVNGLDGKIKQACSLIAQ